MLDKELLQNALDTLRINPEGFGAFLKQSEFIGGFQTCPRIVRMNGQEISNKPNIHYTLKLHTDDECIVASCHIDSDRIKLDMCDLKRQQRLSTNGEFYDLKKADMMANLAVEDDPLMDEDRKTALRKQYGINF